MDYPGGMTDFAKPFLSAYEIMKQDVDKYVIEFIFMTDGHAEYPTKEIEKIKILKSLKPDRINYYDRINYHGIEFQSNESVMKTIRDQLDGDNVISYSAK